MSYLQNITRMVSRAAPIILPTTEPDPATQFEGYTLFYKGCAPLHFKGRIITNTEWFCAFKTQTDKYVAAYSFHRVNWSSEFKQQIKCHFVADTKEKFLAEADSWTRLVTNESKRWLGEWIIEQLGEPTYL